VRVGVDLGTAYTVLAVLDEDQQPIAGAYQFAQVVRDGLVVDFVGAVALVKTLKARVEARVKFELTSAASGYPPGVPLAEVRATANVIRAAGMECSGLVDEPTAANNVLQIQDGAIVDVGGGTTGIAVFRAGQVVYTADEPTGGTHFSLVIAGAKNLTFEAAEELKKDPRQQPALFPVIRPVMEKVGTIVQRHIAGHNVETLYLVGGTCAFPGMDGVIEEVTGVKTVVPGRPLFITPLGIAMHHHQ
jgi:ethanolamine utilization protein EutJ